MNKRRFKKIVHKLNRLRLEKHIKPMFSMRKNAKGLVLYGLIKDYIFWSEGNRVIVQDKEKGLFFNVKKDVLKMKPFTIKYKKTNRK